MLVFTKKINSMGAMRKITNRRFEFIFFALLAAAMPNTAHAYLDPGTGSMVLQVVVAGVLGALFTFKSYVRAVFSSLGRLFGKQQGRSDA